MLFSSHRKMRIYNIEFNPQIIPIEFLRNHKTPDALKPKITHWTKHMCLARRASLPCNNAQPTLIRSRHNFDPHFTTSPRTLTSPPTVPTSSTQPYERQTPTFTHPPSLIFQTEFLVFIRTFPTYGWVRWSVSKKTSHSIYLLAQRDLTDVLVAHRKTQTELCNATV